MIFVSQLPLPAQVLARANPSAGAVHETLTGSARELGIVSLRGKAERHDGEFRVAVAARQHRFQMPPLGQSRARSAGHAWTGLDTGSVARTLRPIPDLRWCRATMPRVRAEAIVAVLPGADQIRHAAPIQRQELPLQKLVLHCAKDAFYHGNGAVTAESPVTVPNVMVVAPGRPPRPRAPGPSGLGLS